MYGEPITITFPLLLQISAILLPPSCCLPGNLGIVYWSPLSCYLPAASLGIVYWSLLSCYPPAAAYLAIWALFTDLRYLVTYQLLLWALFTDLCYLVTSQLLFWALFTDLCYLVTSQLLLTWQFGHCLLISAILSMSASIHLARAAASGLMCPCCNISMQLITMYT